MRMISDVDVFSGNTEYRSNLPGPQLPLYSFLTHLDIFIQGGKKKKKRERKEKNKVFKCIPLVFSVVSNIHLTVRLECLCSRLIKHI